MFDEYHWSSALFVHEISPPVFNKHYTCITKSMKMLSHPNNDIIWNMYLYTYLCAYPYMTYRHTVRTAWWRHQMETFSALLAICAGNSPVPGEFPTQRPVTRSFDVYFNLRPNKRLSKQLWGWWFETQSRPLWRYRNGILFTQCPASTWRTVFCSRVFPQAKSSPDKHVP